MINYNQLYYFFVTARSGSVTEAARELRIAQPSLSAQLKVLEGALGKKLFERVGRGLRLTEIGQVIYGHCRRIYEAADVLEREVLRGKSAQSRLHIGVVNEIERSFLVEVVGRMLKSDLPWTAGHVKMSSETNDRLLQQLRSLNMDAVITNEPVFDPEFTMLASAQMPVVLAFRGDGRFKKLQGSTPHLLRSSVRELQVTWALPQRPTRLRREIDVFLESAKINPLVTFESDVLATVARAAAADVGVTLLPKPYFRTGSGEQSLRWAGPTDGFWSHGIWLISRKKDLGSTLLESLKMAFKATLRSEKISR